MNCALGTGDLDCRGRTATLTLGVNVAGVLRMQLEATANTAQFLSQQADDLGAELTDIARSWGELS